MGKPSESKSQRKRPPTEQHVSPAKKAKLTQGKAAPKAALIPSNLSKKEKKELIRERKAKTQRNFNLIQDVVTLWEDLRRHDTNPEKRSKLITAVLTKVKGRVADLAASHTASRVIQACVKYGTASERAAVLEEMSPKLLDLSKSPYGHFVVSKLISLAPKEQLPGVFKLFRGHIPALLRHPAGAHVVDDLWAVADTKQRNGMAAEFYGREYVLFEGGTINNQSGAPAHLSALMEGVDAPKRRSIIQRISKDLIPIMEKGLVDPPLVHRLVAEYLECAPASLVSDAVENLCGDPLLHMVHTKEGARAACMVLAYGGAKERKKAVKAMKGHVGTMARDEWGHLVLITALSVVDDTALLKKFIVGDLQKELQELCTHRYAHRVVLQLLHPYCSRYLPPQLLAIARPPQKQYSSTAGAAGQDTQDTAVGDPQLASNGGAQAGQQEGEDGEDEEGEGSPPPRPTSGPLGVSKKDGDTRRREVFGNGPSSLGGTLASLCASKAGDFLRTQGACDVVVEVCRGGEGGVLEVCVGEPAVTAVHRAVAAAVAAGLAGAGESADPLLEHFFASRALRRLILSSGSGNHGASEAGAGWAGDISAAIAARCVEVLWEEGGLQGECAQLVGGHGAKVAAALTLCGSPGVRSAATAELAPLVAPERVEAWAGRFAAGPKHGQQQSNSVQPQGQQRGKQKAKAHRQGKGQTGTSKGHGPKEASGKKRQR